MFTRRLILGTALTAGSFALAGAAHAQAWKAKYPELVLAIVPAENASGVSERYAPFVEYLSKELGTKVTLRHHGHVVRVPVIDRGPYSGAREYDLTEATARRLGFKGYGSIQSTK